MGTKQSRLTEQYEKRLIEVEYIDIDRLSLEELKELSHALEIEMSELDSEKASKLPEEKRDRFKRQYLTIIQGYKDTVRDTETLNELLEELTKLKDLKDKSQEEAETRISTARQELEELKSNKTIYSYHKWDLIFTAEKEFQRLDKETIGQILSQVPQEIRDSIMYATSVKQCRDIVKYYELISQLTIMKAPINKSQETTFERQISTARQELEELKSNKTIHSYHKQVLIQKYETEFQRLDKEVSAQFLNVEVRDSIDLIEKTLAEPHLYSLPHLIMWRNTAQEKIQKLKNFHLPIPQEIVTEKIEKYESLIIQLRAEILKLRTYPIPEPWGSHCMRVELTYLMKGEFIFFVHPGIEEDMRPLKLSDRDILPGGLTRQEYDSRMNRMKRESTTAIEAKNVLFKAEKLNGLKFRLQELRKMLTLHSQNFLSCTEMEGHWNTWSTRIKMTNCCKKYTTLF